ncbi:MAG: Lrp/AsnC family transcriptional regulator [Thermoproteota archaeon]
MYMGLTCKVGAYRRVLEEVLKLNIQKGNTFLLFGPIDILIQFTEVESLDQFIERWFNTIRVIGAEEGLISRSVTLVVIHEGPLFAEEPYAFTFMHVNPAKLEKVQRSLLDMPEVISADTVFGPYDVICAVRADNKEDLENTISTIQRDIPDIEGVITSITAGIRV